MDRTWFAALVVGLLGLGFTTAPALAEEIHWRYDYNSARHEAAEKGKPLLIDFSTEHCFWCKRLDHGTFRDKTVLTTVNERFIPLRIDGEKDAALAQALHIESYPTLVLASPDGKILDSMVGYVDHTAIMVHIRKALGSVSPAQPVVARADGDVDQRTRAARDGLARAKDAYRSRQYVNCLEQCGAVSSHYADLPEAADATQLAAEITSNPEVLRVACDTLSDQLGTLYLTMAETCQRKGDQQQAIVCLERVVRMFPGTRHAEAAQLRLALVQTPQAAPIVGLKAPELSAKPTE